MIKNLEQPYIFAPLNYFQEFLYAKTQKSAFKTELQELNIDSFCNTVQAIMSITYLFNPIININFNSLGLEGWISIKAWFESNKRVRGRAVKIQNHVVAGIQGHAMAKAPTGVAHALLYIVKVSLSFLLLY